MAGYAGGGTSSAYKSVFLSQTRKTASTYLWDALLTWLPLVVRVLARNTEELREHSLVEVSVGLLCSVVRHHSNDEVVRSRSDQGGGEKTGEVVWVLLDRAVGVLCHSACELVHVKTVVLDTLLHGVGETGSAEGVSVAVVDKGVATSDRSVSLILVVRPRDTLSIVDEGNAWLWATDRPGERAQVAVDCNGVGSQESCKIQGHSVSLTKALNGLWERLNTVTRQVSVVGGGIETWAWACDLISVCVCIEKIQ